MPQIVSRSRVWYNPDLKSRNYFIPGVVVNIITLVTLSLTAMAIVREKEIGTMEQLMVTPIRPIELILGKTLPFVLVGYWDLILVTSAALLIFHVPFNGSFLLLLFAAFVFLMTTLGAGLFLSTISRTQQQAMMATTLFFQPFFMLSGFTFPIRNMPESVQWLTYLESGALLHGDRSRRVPARRRDRHAVAANRGAGDFRSHHIGTQRQPLPQTTGIGLSATSPGAL